MPTYLDDNPVDLAGANVGSVLNAAQDRLASAGRIIVEVMLDGQLLVDRDLDREQSTAVEGRELRLTSADAHQLTVSTLDQVRGRLEELRQIQADAADLFQQDKPSDAIKKVAAAMTIWQQAQQVVAHSAILTRLQLDERKIDDHPVKDTIDLLADQLRALRDALSRGDTVSVADALAYEWPATIDRWQALVDHMIQWIESSKTHGQP